MSPTPSPSPLSYDSYLRSARHRVPHTAPTPLQLADNVSPEPFPGLPVEGKRALPLLTVSAPNSPQKYSPLQNRRDRRPSHPRHLRRPRRGDRSIISLPPPRRASTLLAPMWLTCRLAFLQLTPIPVHPQDIKSSLGGAPDGFRRGIGRLDPVPRIARCDVAPMLLESRPTRPMPSFPFWEVLPESGEPALISHCSLPFRSTLHFDLI